MTIPNYESIMLPLLKLASDQQEHSNREVIDRLAEELSVTQSERRELLPSGRQAVFDNRTGWAQTYMKKARLLGSTRRGWFQITDRGLEVLNQRPARIDVEFLNQFAEFREFRAPAPQSLQAQPQTSPEDQESTHEEVLVSAHQSLMVELASDVLEQVKAVSPEQFERIVVKLLVAIGYGGNLKDAGAAIGRSGDEGVDGMIKEDPLGLDIIYVQAKKWDGTVGRPEIQKFAGALEGQRAKKGIFITTSSFTKEARDFVSRISSRIVLIDGERLARAMIDKNVGVTSLDTYEVKRLDLDYFTE